MIVYLASPYTHPDPEIRTQRFEQICKVAARLASDGVILFCPIAQSHPLALYGDLQTNWEFWRDFDTEFISKCDELWVTMMDGWKESRGVQDEIKIAQLLDKPVRYIEP